MGNVEIGATGIVITLVLIALRVPVGVSLGLVAFGGISLIHSSRVAWGILSGTPFEFVGNWSLTAAPMFLLMGYLCGATGLTTGLFSALRMFLSRLPGGLAVSSVGACALFASASGSSVATSAAMSRIAVPEMLRYNYDKGLATGVIAASGTLGSLIPPSVLMVIYGVYAQVSIGQLFLAGFLPGILTAVLYATMIMVRAKISPELAGRVDERFTWRQKAKAVRDVWPLPILVMSVIGGIFFGVFSPTEAGALGAFAAATIALLRGSLNWSTLKEALVNTALSTASIFLILIGSILFTRFMAFSGLPSAFADLVLGISTHYLWILFAIAIIYVILGMFIDSIGLLLLTLPIVLPLVEGAELSLIWFGILAIKLLEVGLVTPPIGLNVYVIKGALGKLVTLPQVFKGVGWFVLMDLIAVILIIAFPMIALWLPAQSFG